MNGTADHLAIPDAGAERLQSSRNLRAESFFLILMWAYLSRTLILRWLYPYLFFKVTARDLVKATGFELHYMVYSSCLAVTGWMVLLYVIAHRLPRISRRLLVPLALLFVLVIAFVEIDMTWFGMSHRHVALQQFLPGLEEIGGGQWGVSRADVTRYALQISKQAAVIGGLALLCRLGERLPWLPHFHLRPGLVVLVFIALFTADSAMVGHRLAQGNKQWDLLIAANGFRLTFADRLWERFFRSAEPHHSDVEEANRALLQPRFLSPTVRHTPLHQHGILAGKRLNLLLVVVESFNSYKPDASNMPALSRLKESSYFFLNHYSTANFSEGGQLGLLYGTQPTFYRGNRPADVPGSPYVQLFNDHGYRSRAIGHNLKNWRWVDTYLLNFSEPALELGSDSDLIPALRAEWENPGPHFVALFYYGTHFPFEHAARFASFQPETPADFDYFSAHLVEHRAEIVNRYRNALLDLDAWLESALKTVHLDDTVIVITGDHGEELFENGVLGHASDLDAPQIKTPLLIRVPGQGHREFEHVTSHADVVPTIVDWMGWQLPAGAVGTSFLDDETTGRATAADTNYPDPPHRWAVITGDRKSIVEKKGSGTLKITSLLDASDRPTFFKDDPAAWEENFGQVRLLQEAVAGSAVRKVSAIPDQRAIR